MKKNNLHLEISNVIEPQVVYKGSVKILYIDKSSGKRKVIKRQNNGHAGLFTAICRGLVGMDTSQYVPQYIDLRDSENKSTISNKRITYASTPTLYKSCENGDVIANISDADIVQYKFIILANDLDRGKSTSSIVLYNEKNQVCATLDLKENLNADIGSNIEIYWSLKFESKSDNT